MFEWYHWAFYVMLSIGTLVRLAKATGWRPKPDGGSNGEWAAVAVAYPILWITIFYQAGFWG